MRASLSILLTATLCLGCQSLMPRQRTDIETQWTSFDEARRAYDSVVVGQTTTPELAALGFDPIENPNVDIQTYVDVFAKFIPNDAARLEDQAPGVQECIAARNRCVGYRVETFREFGREYGSFWLNLLTIREQTEVEGWFFEALLVMVDDRVTYKLWEGNPSIVKRQDTIRPLGPLQDIDVRVNINFP